MERGSEKVLHHLFGADGKPSPEQLAKAIATAQETAGFKIVRWWWFGQPAIDRFIGEFHVEATQVGGFVQNLVGRNNEKLAIGVEVFPLGIPVPDLFRVNATIDQHVR